MLHGADYRKDASPALPVPRRVDIRSGGSGPEQAVSPILEYGGNAYASKMYGDAEKQQLA